MNILVYNGSPKGTQSNTLKLTQAFLKGLNEKGEHTIEIIDVSKASINHCIGCFNCWTKTPGKCVFKDDMPAILEHYLKTDVIIWSFPLYYFGLPSKLKALMDRQLPLNLPYMMEREDGGSGHPSRYDLSQKRYILISTCGFYSTQNNYDAIHEQFRILYGDNITKIICPEGELFGVAPLKKRTDEYLSYVQAAGRDYNASGTFSAQTQAKLSELLYPPETFIELADASWEIAPTEETDSSTPGDAPHSIVSKAHGFMRQMAAIYNPASFSGKDIILEMYFTDLQETYQLLLGKEKCLVKEKDFSPYTTRIETPFSTWLDISNGKLNGAKAMMEHKYKTLGDFNIMLKMDDLFGTGDSSSEDTSSSPSSNGSSKKTNMSLMIFPWFIIWVFMAINPMWGGILGILSAVLVPLLSAKWKLTYYEQLSTFMVALLSLLALLGLPVRILVPLSYLFFGLMWTASCLTPIPLTAHYSMNDYNGAVALKNALFMKTNLILTLCWGVLYLVTPIWTYVIMGTSLAPLIGLINSLCPLLLGLFTAWFQKWYPAKVASQ